MIEVAPGETIRLHDGRRLGFAQFGDLSGTPVFFFHGGGDSRMQRHSDDNIAAALGIRLITIDRPGVGLSDFKPGRRLGDWAEDVAQLADALGLQRFAVLGYSMGGPHALACAARLEGRLTVAGVVSGVAPFDRPGAWDGVSTFVRRMFVLARRSPYVVWVPLRRMGRKARTDPGALLDELFAEASEYDRRVWAHPGRRENQMAATHEAARQGPRGLSWELAMIGRPWNVRLNTIRVPVLLWYGTADRTTPPQMGRYLAGQIPGARLTLWPDAGHQAIFLHWQEVLTAVREYA